MNAFCTECGEQLIPGDRFCASCGAAIENPSADASADVVSVPVAAARTSGVATDVAPPSLAARAANSKQRAGVEGFAKKVRESVTAELVKGAVLRTAAAWVVVWIAVAIVVQVGLSIADQPDVLVGAPTLASAIMSCGFGGSLEGTASVNLFVFKGSVSAWAHIMPFVIPLAYAVLLLLASKFQRAKQDRYATTASGAVAAACAAVLAVATSLFSHTSVDGFSGNLEGLAVPVGASWLVPALVAGILTFAAVTLPSLVAERKNSKAADDIKLALGDLAAVTKIIGAILIAAAALAILYQGFRIGTGADSGEISKMFGFVLGFLLLLPNIIVASLSLLTGAQFLTSAQWTGDTDALPKSWYGSGDLTRPPWGLPGWAILAFVLVVALVLAALWGINSKRPSARAWWVDAAIFGLVGVLLTHFGSLLAGGVVTVNTVLGGGSATASASYGFNPFEIGLRFALLGALIGAARHPAVLSMLRPVGQPLSELATRGAQGIRRRLGIDKVVARIRGVKSVPTSDVVDTSGEDFQRSALRLGAFGGVVVAVILLVPISVLLGKGVYAVTGAFTDSPEEILTQVQDAVRAGDGGKLSELIKLDSGEAILSSTGGVSDVTGTMEGDEGDYRSGTVNWKVGEEPASGTVYVFRSTEAGFLGLFPQWQLGNVSGLPVIKGETTVNGDSSESAVVVDGVTIGARDERSVMPGKVTVAAVASAKPEWVVGKADSQVTAVTGDVRAPVTYSVTPPGAVEAKGTAGKILDGCGKTTDSSICPYNSEGCWAPSPDDVGVYGEPVAVGPNSIEVPVLQGALKYGPSYAGTCNADTSLEGPVLIAVGTNGMGSEPR